MKTFYDGNFETVLTEFMEIESRFVCLIKIRNEEAATKAIISISEFFLSHSSNLKRLKANFDVNLETGEKLCMTLASEKSHQT